MTQRLSIITSVFDSGQKNLPAHSLPLPEGVRNAEDAEEAQEELNELIAEETMRMQIPVNMKPPLC